MIACRMMVISDSVALNCVEQTYNASFPEVERRDFGLVRSLLCDESRFRMMELRREEDYVGFITSWQFEGFVYVEHFAIDEIARNGGLGSDAMGKFLADCQLPVVLEVELPMDDISRRRIGFYERLGFRLHEQLYFQPPYRVGEGELEMRLMVYGDLDLNECFNNVVSIIHYHVYGKKQKKEN